MPPLVTIVVPVWEESPDPDACIASVCAQTHDDLDILLVGDNARIEGWAARDARVRALPGRFAVAGDARNAGIPHARGAYIQFAQAGVILTPHMTRALLGSALEHDADVVLCHCLRTGARGERELRCFETRGVYSRAALLRSFAEGKTRAYAFNKLYKRELLSERSFAPGLPCADALFFRDMILTALDWAVVDEPLCRVGDDARPTRECARALADVAEKMFPEQPRGEYANDEKLLCLTHALAALRMAASLGILREERELARRMDVLIRRTRSQLPRAGREAQSVYALRATHLLAAVAGRNRKTQSTYLK